VDALAALRMWAYETTFPNVRRPGGSLYVFRIEPLPAADWIDATLDMGHLSYLPGLLPPAEREILLEAIEDGTVTAAQLAEENQAALEAASGWAWWSASKLIGTLGKTWETTGALLTLSGVDPTRVSLGAFLSALYGLIWRDASKEDRLKLAAEVAAMPPELVSPDGVWDEDAATDAVWAVMRAQGHSIG
jgi:hypothetical protein